MPDLPLLLPSIALLGGAVVAGVVGRVAERLAAVVGLLAAIFALAAIVALYLIGTIPEPTLAWIPGSVQTGLVVAFRADAVSLLFASLCGVLALALFLGDRSALPAAVAARLAAFAAAILAFFAGSLATAGALILVATIALAVEAQADADGSVDSLGGPILAGLALLAAGAVGAGSVVGFLLVLLAVLVLCGQYPLTWVLQRALGGHPSPVGAALQLATLVPIGGYVAVRWLAPVAPVWGIQALGICGALTTVTASALMLWQRRLDGALALLAVGQVGYVLLAIGEGRPAATAAGILHLAAILPLAVGALILTSSLPVRDFAAIRRSPVGGLIGVLAACLAGAPLITGALIARWVLIADALADGRVGFAVLALGGALLGAIATARLIATLLGGLPDDRPIAWQAVVAAGILTAGAVALGVLSWTGSDPASAAAVAATGLPRDRPVAGDLFAVPVWAAAGAIGGLLIAGAAGAAIGWRRRVEPELALGPAYDSSLMVIDESLAPGAPVPVSAALDPAVVELAIWRWSRAIGWFIAAGLGALEGRYYVAAVLVFGLWLAIVFMG